MTTNEELCKKAKILVQIYNILNNSALLFSIIDNLLSKFLVELLACNLSKGGSDVT